MGGWFRVPMKDGSTISGMRGGSVHAHESPFGVGVLKSQGEPKENLGTYNRFNQEVDDLLEPFPCFKKP